MLATGDVFAGYAIERQLGRGGMGSVYLARHPRLPRQTALKLLNPELFSDDEIRARFEREADLAAQLDHPNIVTVYDRGVDDGRLWISMQFVDGVDAATIEHPVPAPRALHIIEGTAAALDHAHRNGVLHRDVKPANILLADANGPERVLLTDFGIARPRDDVHHLTQTGTFTATLAFASPEQLTGAPLDHRADQYSLACTLYSLLTGRAPYEATNPVLVIQGHLQSPPPSVHGHRPDLPVALDAVLARALAKRPADRFDSCAEFAAAARRALTGTGAQPTVFAHRAGPAAVPRQFVSPVPAPPVRPMMAHYPVPPRRARGVVAMILLTVFAVVAGASYWIWQDESTWVSQILNRSRAHRDIAAMSAAFPRMLPPGDADGASGSSPYLTGVGAGGRSCEAYVNTTKRNEFQWELTFRDAHAKWSCKPADPDATTFAFYAFPSEESAKAAVTRFEGETKDVGSGASGTRSDDHRALFRKNQNGADSYTMTVVVSTFTDPGRERWVFLFSRDSDLLDQDLPALLRELTDFPMN
ncbi:serine/threonine-protein kinase [Nocardia caishijiensis]|uniref:non-specific serine/threonine protein kinase n=1 Tax=Nocardia caishijiensis TaxID=184756 RepID=A0ABQ6YQA5_9NOCA|nr:serine/threonine-protein kinase [Nocardia caishijiensis]KAF0847833.1 serine/threonine-protein kinase [Nocardia caishijiensis]